MRGPSDHEWDAPLGRALLARSPDPAAGSRRPDVSARTLGAPRRRRQVRERPCAPARSRSAYHRPAARPAAEPEEPALSQLARRIVDAPRFQHAIALVIVLAGILVGVETDAQIAARHARLLHALDALVLGVFVVEIALKLLAEGSRPGRFFRDPWNVFDFVIVALCFAPIQGQYVTVLRLVRLLRVLRLLRALPRLQLLVTALLHSIPPMGYVAMFLGLLFYIYGVAAVFLFGGNDPVRFGTLGSAVLSLFTVVTLEGWAELMYTQMYGCDRFGYDAMAALCTAPLARPTLAPLFFVSFVLLGTMIVLNLFIGVIMNSMQEAAAQLEGAAEARRVREGGKPAPTLEHELFELQRAMHELASRVSRLQKRASAEHGGEAGAQAQARE